jgi:hypothetical protein
LRYLIPLVLACGLCLSAKPKDAQFIPALDHAMADLTKAEENFTEIYSALNDKKTLNSNDAAHLVAAIIRLGDIGKELGDLKRIATTHFELEGIKDEHLKSTIVDPILDILLGTIQDEFENQIADNFDNPDNHENYKSIPQDMYKSLSRSIKAADKRMQDLK